MMYDGIVKDNDPTESLNDNVTGSTGKSYLSALIELMMREMDITSYDDRTCHMLVDLLQRESLLLLKASVENSERRLSSESEKLLLGNSSTTSLTKPNMKVTEEDSMLVCQEYINNNVIQSGITRDLLDVHKYANNVRFASKQTIVGNKTRSYSAYRGEDEMGQFPSGPIPHLPDNLSLNTLLPHWDITLRENK
ncbi:conserved hypothetical protein [Theileria orientalis strain Shintoku]|uniref:Uncharacterized protein n=1 Tax=Theileria orientalis strain Shintoku TaxID=869250 RepID=J4C922_THEOR|nr:conserved hypothetical protein [Theileria orientalis strain Shintoku]BAM41783.1 conserved hypothetical protein [Theileria orientalis strain Shintoku]|eukprot:XP_009692084.1 conserved hypothetical protein [Theileria orientalis strain Shintoku]